MRQPHVNKWFGTLMKIRLQIQRLLLMNEVSHTLGDG